MSRQIRLVICLTLGFRIHRQWSQGRQGSCFGVTRVEDKMGPGWPGEYKRLVITF